MNGIEMIAQERREQLEKFGFTVERDAAKYKNGELAQVAVALLDGNMSRFPHGWDPVSMNALAGKTTDERLALSGAFAAAQIDVNQYIAAQAITKPV